MRGDGGGDGKDEVGSDGAEAAGCSRPFPLTEGWRLGGKSSAMRTDRFEGDLGDGGVGRVVGRFSGVLWPLSAGSDTVLPLSE